MNEIQTPKVKPRICACVVGIEGTLLPYSTRSTMQECEEWAQENLLNWEKQKKLGARIVQTELTVIKDSK